MEAHLDQVLRLEPSEQRAEALPRQADHLCEFGLRDRDVDRRARGRAVAPVRCDALDAALQPLLGGQPLQFGDESERALVPIEQQVQERPEAPRLVADDPLELGGRKEQGAKGVSAIVLPLFAPATASIPSRASREVAVAPARRCPIPGDRGGRHLDPNGPKLNAMLAIANRPMASNAAAVISVSETGNALSPWISPSAFICARSRRSPAMNCT